MEVCGEPEVFYHSPSGSGDFRSNLIIGREKAEQAFEPPSSLAYSCDAIRTHSRCHRPLQKDDHETMSI